VQRRLPYDAFVGQVFRFKLTKSYVVYFDGPVLYAQIISDDLLDDLTLLLPKSTSGLEGKIEIGGQTEHRGNRRHSTHKVRRGRGMAESREGKMTSKKRQEGVQEIVMKLY